MNELAERLRNFRVWNNRQSRYEPVPLCQEAAAVMTDRFDWTEILPEPERSKVRAQQGAFLESFPTREELEQAGREGREAFAKACAQVDRQRISDLVAELRKLQDIIDSQADRILDLEALAVSRPASNSEAK